MDISVDVCGLHFEHPIMNGAGTCKNLEQVRKLSKSASSAIVLGSITFVPREGNSGNVFYNTPHYSLNSLGLPNPGLAETEKVLPEMVRIAHDAGKPFIFSAAGFCPQDYAILSASAFSCGVDIVELNLGCPNVWGADGKQKKIASFDRDLINSILTVVYQNVGNSKRIAVKLSPFSDPSWFLSIVGFILNYPMVKALTLSNTMPIAYGIGSGGGESISNGIGLAGMAGLALKPINLGRIRELRCGWGPEMHGCAPFIIGAGGVSAGFDVVEYLGFGAELVQVATAYYALGDDRGERIFSEILEQYSSYHQD